MNNERGYDPYNKPDVCPDWLRPLFLYEARLLCEVALAEEKRLARLDSQLFEEGYDPYDTAWPKPRPSFVYQTFTSWGTLRVDSPTQPRNP